MMDKMTVGEAAHAIGVSTMAIRLWESKGLIPKAERTATGYRTFTNADLAILRFIRQAKTLGLTLGEIKDVIAQRRAGSDPCQRVVAAIDQHLAEIDRALADLHQLRQTLLAARGGERCGADPADRSHICRIIEDRDG